MGAARHRLRVGPTRAPPGRDQLLVARHRQFRAGQLRWATRLTATW